LQSFEPWALAQLFYPFRPKEHIPSCEGASADGVPGVLLLPRLKPGVIVG